jgi:O-antigen ligase
MKQFDTKKYFGVILGLSIVAFGFSFVLAQLGFTLLSLLVAVLLAGTYFVFIFKNPFFGIATVIFLLPFERIGSVDIGNITVRPSQVVALVTIVAFVWERLASNKFSFQKNPIVLPTLAFLIENLFSLFHAVNFNRGVEVFVFTLFVALVSFVIPQIVTKKEHVQKIILVLMISAVLVSVFGIYQFIGDLVGIPIKFTGLLELYSKSVFGFPRIQSTAAEPLYFANYLMIPLGIAASMLLASRKHKTFSWLFLVLLFGVNFVLTLSRGGYLGLIGLLAVLGVGHHKKVFSKKNLSLYVVILVVIAAAGASLLGLSPNAREAVDTFWTQAFNFSSGTSINERQGTINDAFVAWKGHPYLGIGPGNFGPSVADQPLITPPKGWLIVNNETIEILTETGAVGLMLFSVVLLVLFVRSLKSLLAARDPYIRTVLLGAFAAFVGILIQYQTFSTLFVLHIWVLFGFLIALQNIAVSHHDQENREEILEAEVRAPK